MLLLLVVLVLVPLLLFVLILMIIIICFSDDREVSVGQASALTSTAPTGSLCTIAPSPCKAQPLSASRPLRCRHTVSASTSGTEVCSHCRCLNIGYRDAFTLPVPHRQMLSITLPSPQRWEHRGAFSPSVPQRRSLLTRPWRDLSLWVPEWRTLRGLHIASASSLDNKVLSSSDRSLDNDVPLHCQCLNFGHRLDIAQANSSSSIAKEPCLWASRYLSISLRSKGVKSLETLPWGIVTCLSFVLQS